MRSLEIQPSYENIRDTFINDSIGRNEGIFHYLNLLNSVENSFSLAIDSYWGSGKTFFVKQLKMVLDANNDFVNNSYLVEDKDKILAAWKKCNIQNIDIQPQVTVYYDAWENDNDSDPILSLVYCILQNADKTIVFDDKERKNKILDLLSSIFDCIKNTNISSVIEKINALNKNESLEPIISNKNLHQLISEFLESILPERGNRLVIFVDELDRCKPNFAVKFLERVKHYFNSENISFVFSVNLEELQHTIKSFYGNDFDASRYLDRFFNLRLSLPQADMDKFYQSIDFPNTSEYYELFPLAVINFFGFELREITRFITDVKMATYDTVKKYPKMTDPITEANLFLLLSFAPFMIGLKIYDFSEYTKFIKGDNCKILSDYFSSIEGMEHFFSRLLDEKESFSVLENSTNQLISLSDKIKEVYNAIFGRQLKKDYFSQKIGQLKFTYNSKKLLLNTVNLTSNNTSIK